MRSPFRYPGAKTRLLRNLMCWFAPYMQGRNTFVEPFVGGGSVLLRIADEFPHCRFVANDLDWGVSAFWKCITSPLLTAGLIERIKTTTPTIEEHGRQQNQLDARGVLDSAFATLFCNRTSFSGLLTSGPIGGEKQESRHKVGCRYNAELLVRIIQDIHEHVGNRLIPLNEDFQSVIETYDRDDVVIYCDSPYYSKGDMLYRERMGHADHIRLCDSLRGLRCARFIASYDDVPEVRKMYDGFAVKSIPVRYSIEGANRESWASRQELVFFSRVPVPAGSVPTKIFLSTVENPSALEI